MRVMSRRRLGLRAAGVAGVAALLGACAAIESKDRSDLLAGRARAYVRAVRWGDFATAASFLRRRDGVSEMPDMAHLKRIRVTSDEHTLIAAGEDNIEARMLARFEYQPPDSATVLGIEQDVLWWYEAETGTWYIDGGLPNFRHER